MKKQARRGTQGRLLADIGGTNARFALQAAGTSPKAFRRLRCADFPDLISAVRAYLAAVQPARAPLEAAFAVASPVVGDRIRMTNHPWSFSIKDVRDGLGLEGLRVINDFEAIAWSVPRLKSRELRKIGRGRARANAPFAIIGPGTGLGVSALIPREKGWKALASEGGHVTPAPATDRESEVLGILRRRFDHVSAERLLSGQGLVNLYEALAELEGQTTRRKSAARQNMAPEKVTKAALERSDGIAAAAVAMFCEMLGTTAGNLALTFGAHGGVYIAGGIVPKLGRAFGRSGFRRRFEDKGRFSTYLARIPTYVIAHPRPAFIGLASFLDSEGV
ncbi:MAG: glucokinase [Alphaproteobacteria bacterium]